ncbi:vacuolar membrane protein [Trichosporon asahii var. asahii CBS 8904]|uniref:Vacuolar membrane protein n=1 Tax=Trichosporon asahii var. asahii (strain CBS 8904) TaxID=1220162 RepID=K1VWY6_TRIAC|nr:vacuolar membrane protein [Trichosporon asahii var. asahii CBS 8904]
MIDRATLASLFGYASIACWLLAQFPQVVKNWQLQSCDGLSLPFLINWLVGDVTNLIGCVLTDQLPFQTYLATYFVFVDVTLVGQYFYYAPRTKPPPQPESMTASPRTSLILPRRTSSYSEHHSPILPRRGGSGKGHARTAPCAPPVDSAEAMYAAALDVARAAERISRRGGSGRGRPRHHHTLPPDASSSTEHIRGSVSSSQYSEDEDDETRTHHHRMTQSLVLPPRPPRSSSWLSNDDRGRSLTRISDIASGSQTPDTLESQLPELRRPKRHHSRSQSVRAHGTGRRAAGVAFMGLGFIFMRATSTGGEAGSTAGGHVVPIASEAEMTSHPWWQPKYPAPLPSLYDAPTTVVTFANSSHPGGGHDDDDDDDKPGGPHKPEPINIRELIGRFQRRSVEGLSMLLFLMAFCGNVFYVLSILVAPVKPDEQIHYLFLAHLWQEQAEGAACPAAAPLKNVRELRPFALPTPRGRRAPPAPRKPPQEESYGPPLPQPGVPKCADAQRDGQQCCLAHQQPAEANVRVRDDAWG